MAGTGFFSLVLKRGPSPNEGRMQAKAQPSSTVTPSQITISSQRLDPPPPSFIAYYNVRDVSEGSSYRFKAKKQT